MIPAKNRGKMRKWKDEVFDAFKGITNLTKNYDVPKSLIRKAKDLQRDFEMKESEPKRGGQ